MSVLLLQKSGLSGLLVFFYRFYALMFSKIKSRRIKAVICWLGIVAGCAEQGAVRPVIVDESAAVPVIENSETSFDPLFDSLQTDNKGSASSAIEQLFENAAQALDSGDLETATVTVERAIRLAPHDPRGYLLLADLRAQEGDYDQVGALLNKARRLSVDNKLMLERIDRFQRELR